MTVIFNRLFQRIMFFVLFTLTTEECKERRVLTQKTPRKTTQNYRNIQKHPEKQQHKTIVTCIIYLLRLYNFIILFVIIMEKLYFCLEEDIS